MTKQNKNKVKSENTIKTTKVSAAHVATHPTTSDDVKTAILVVSVVLNLTVLILWLILQTTTSYDAQALSVLLNR